MQKTMLINKTTAISLIFILLCVGFLQKINNTAHTESATGIGGVWNVVTIFIYACRLLFFKSKRLPTYYISGVLFCFFAILASILNVQSLSVSFLYNILIIPYFLIILHLFELAGEIYGRRLLENKWYYISYFAIAVLVGIYLYGYLSSNGIRYVVTDAYYLLTMLPLLLLSKNKWIKYGGIVSASIVLLLSGKRTGFVAFVVGLLVFFLIDGYCSKFFIEKFKKMFRTAAIILIGIAFLSFIAQYFDLNFFQRLEMAFTEGEGGREIIWGRIIDAMKDASIGEWIFGHGIKQVPILIGSKNALAHCDFLEILYDYGIIPLIFIVGFWFSIIKKSISMLRTKEPMSGAVIYSIIVSLFLSAFSNYIIDATYITYSMITLGLIFGIYRKELEEKQSV